MFRAMHVRSAFLLATALLAAGCDRSPTPSGPPLPGSARSLEALGSAVVSSLARGDTATLEGFRLSEREYREVVWPKMPEAQAGTITYEWSRMDLDLRNRRALKRYLEGFRAQPLRARATGCRGQTDVYDGFEVLRDCWVRVARDGGPEAEMQLFKSVVVYNGGLKIFRYDD